MKVVTIFSGKGGVGKTTMSILFASWLKYYMKQRVFAYDFESPESRMVYKRNKDLQALEQKTQSLTHFVESMDFYPIGAIQGKPGGYSNADLNRIADGLEQAKSTGEGYIICDFPGRFESKEAVYTLVRRGLIDLIVFPIQPEEQSVASMLMINQYLRDPSFVLRDGQPSHQEIMCFWNMVTYNDRRGKQDILANYEKVLDVMKIHVSPTRIRFVDTVKRPSSSAVMVTTTICYPRFNIMKTFPPDEGETIPYIEKLFQEIKDKVDSI